MIVCSTPASLLLASWVVALLGIGAGAPPWASVLAACLVFVGLAGLSYSAPAPSGTMWTGAFLFVCLLAGLLRILWPVCVPPAVPSVREIEGVVSLERKWGYAHVILVDSASGRFLIRVPPSRTASEGSLVSVTGRAVPLPSPDVRKRDRSRVVQFREDVFWRARGVVAEFVPSSVEETGMSSWTFSSLRTELRRRIVSAMPARMQAYLLAAWVGVKDPELQEDHARWGTAHLLAVSGFHVGIAVAAFMLFLRPVARRLPRLFPAVFHEGGVLFTSVAASVVLWAYVGLTGAAASALRAALMVQVILAGQALGRPAKPVNSVCVAACALLLWNPWQFWDLGWRLSVVAALTLAALADLRGVRGLFVSGPVVWVATYPLVAASFGTVPVVGLLLNFVAIPAFSLIFPLISLLAAPGLSGLPGGVVAASLGERILTLWEGFAEATASFIPGTVSWSILGAGGAAIVFLTLMGRGMALSVRRSLFMGILGAFVVFELF